MTDWPRVAATGHRPQHLDPACHNWVRGKLAAGAVWLRDTHGMTVGITGMALGVDMWWAQAVLDAGLDLWAYLPFEQQPDRWPTAQQAEWRRLVKAAAHVHVVGDLTGAADRRREAVRLLHARNDAMLRDAQAVVAVLNPDAGRGGTRSAVEKAEQRRLPLIWIDPVGRRVVGPVNTILRQAVR